MKKISSILLFSFLILSSTFVFGSEPEDEIKILVSSLDSCKGCVFIRNGSEHKLDEAKAHLLKKYDAAKSKISSTEDFIKGLASKSSITGTPYKIKFPDGKEVESEKWLTDKLNELRNPPAITKPKKKK
ncbi:hypothetical protein CH352_16885 [Leptospira hartskeerlii]|uniref:Uncharacterized protein n=1 Tax=Leptospira hartskeerlii TaxID=2023177 RepID=A0A2M9XIG5_9LEPT|nr:DUF5329 domain-containing protein [Leptospira hartskeerlii]PJZ27481.1 hypothetical protein CH357_02730 [Leptospira hartskeerlii]PJZ32338.1 hypothetical protein CH352_16885 [Leptospira hartskeerlii]